MNQDVYRTSNVDSQNNNWSALDKNSKHPLSCVDDDDTQDAANKSKTTQFNEEYILIKDSCDVTINSTDTKAAINLQAGLQAAIVILISISLGSSERAEEITQELLQTSKVKQVTRQETIVENSRDIQVTTVDTQAAANIQILLQLLIAIAVKLNIL